jgi:hypothetical protein
MRNNKVFTLTNGDKTLVFDCYQRFLSTDHKYRNNKNDFFIGRVERDVTPPILSSEELYDMVS